MAGITSKQTWTLGLLFLCICCVQRNLLMVFCQNLRGSPGDPYWFGMEWPCFLRAAITASCHMNSISLACVMFASMGFYRAMDGRYNELLSFLGRWWHICVLLWQRSNWLSCVRIWLMTNITVCKQMWRMLQKWNASAIKWISCCCRTKVEATLSTAAVVGGQTTPSIVKHW